jgi:arabinose-5-phosphate isomerase
VVVDARSQVDGVLTAGDLSRLVERTENLWSVPIHGVMTRSPKLARSGELASAVLYRMERHGIMAMPVVNEAEELVGVVHLHDLMRARVG